MTGLFEESYFKKRFRTLNVKLSNHKINRITVYLQKTKFFRLEWILLAALFAETLWRFNEFERSEKTKQLLFENLTVKWELNWELNCSNSELKCIISELNCSNSELNRIISELNCMNQELYCINLELNYLNW